MPPRPYLLTCKKCSVEFYGEWPAKRYCNECVKISDGVDFYPKIFYKNRAIVFKRDENKCQCCGCSNGELRTNKLIVHHIDVNKQNNSLSNLITLCEQCHHSLHKKYDKHTLRVSNIHRLFAEEKRFGEFGKTLMYEPAKEIVKKQFKGNPKKFFRRNKTT